MYTLKPTIYRYTMASFNTSELYSSFLIKTATMMTKHYQMGILTDIKRIEYKHLKHKRSTLTSGQMNAISSENKMDIKAPVH